MIEIYLKEFYTLINSISFLTNANVTFYLPDRKLLPSDPTNYFLEKKKFCTAINATELHKECIESDSYALSSLSDESGNCKLYKCHAGLVEIAFRITYSSTFLGYAIVGPFRDPKTEEADLKRVREISLKTGTPHESLKKNFLDIDKLTEQKFYALKNLFFSIFDYMGIKNYIFQKKNVFSLQIEPYIQQHLNEELSVDFLCKHFHITPKTLYRLFHTHANVTPKHYILSARIEKCLHLLRSTDIPISEIAEMVGFVDYSYFSKIFKSFIGESPNNYRKGNKHTIHTS